MLNSIQVGITGANFRMDDALSSDRELMQRVLRREQSALSDLYQQYGSAIYSMALRVLRDSREAEEITQDVFLRVWNAPEKWDETKGRLISWLLTVTRYAAIDRLRAENRRALDVELQEETELAGETSEFNTPEWQNGQIVRRLLTQLPPEQSQVIEMAFFGGLTHRELADRLNLPIGTVKTRVRLGLQKLRQLWLEATRESL